MNVFGLRCLFDKKCLFDLEILNGADGYTSLEFRGEDWAENTKLGHQVMLKLSETG